MVKAANDPPAHGTPIRPFISVMIPAIDEAAALPATLANVCCPLVEHEIIVVDGGSSDATTQIAAKAGCRVIKARRRQRAAQMNLGAQAARGAVLLFLHADTRLAPGAMQSMQAALRNPRVAGGAFARRYDSPSRVLGATCRLAELRNRLFGWHLGDQAMFVRRDLFERLRGFAEVDMFEDLDFSRRLARYGKLVTLRPPVVSCARRFGEHGPLRTTCRDFLLTCRYLVKGLAAPSPLTMPSRAHAPLAATRSVL